MDDQRPSVPSLSESMLCPVCGRKELLLPSLLPVPLLPLLMMMTLMMLLLLLHCRCRCRCCCRGFHCPCCCCGRCGVRWLPPLRASKSAAAVIGSGGGGFTARAAAASGRCAGDASGTRRGSGGRVWWRWRSDILVHWHIQSKFDRRRERASSKGHARTTDAAVSLHHPRSLNCQKAPPAPQNIARKTLQN